MTGEGVALYGSVVNGYAVKGSDLDIAYWGMSDLRAAPIVERLCPDAMLSTFRPSYTFKHEGRIPMVSADDVAISLYGDLPVPFTVDLPTAKLRLAVRQQRETVVVGKDGGRNLLGLQDFVEKRGVFVPPEVERILRALKNSWQGPVTLALKRRGAGYALDVDLVLPPSEAELEQERLMRAGASKCPNCGRYGNDVYCCTNGRGLSIRS